MLLKPSIQFLIDGQGLLLVERKAMLYDEVYVYLEFFRLKTTVTTNFN